MVDGNTTLTGNVKLPAHLSYKTDSESSDHVPSNTDHLVGVERELIIVQGSGGELRQDETTERTLQRQHSHVLRPETVVSGDLRHET